MVLTNFFVLLFFIFSNFVTFFSHSSAQASPGQSDKKCLFQICFFFSICLLTLGLRANQPATWGDLTAPGWHACCYLINRSGEAFSLCLWPYALELAPNPGQARLPFLFNSARKTLTPLTRQFIYMPSWLIICQIEYISIMRYQLHMNQTFLKKILLSET